MYLSTHRLSHGEELALARLLGVSARTLRNWRARRGETGSPGHPPHSAEARREAREETERVRKDLPRGHKGWRSVRAQLVREGKAVPTRLIQSSVRNLRQESRVRETARIEENRVHVEVHARDALWALDQTLLMRDEQGELRSLHLREGLAPHTLGLSIGGPACGKDVVHLLERTARERGCWPLVLQADNGPENKNADVHACLQRERVVVLWNEPRTPQHNPRAERSIGAMKRASGLDGRAARGADPSHGPVRASDPGVSATQACLRLLAAWTALDDETPRAGLRGLTPVELDTIAPRAEDHVCRDRFHADVCEGWRRVALAPLDARARRAAEREVVWSTLQRYGLVTRTRGGCLVPTLKAEGIS
jgi:hypothetical protein